MSALSSTVRTHEGHISSWRKQRPRHKPGVKSFGKTHRQASPSDFVRAVYFTFIRSYLTNTIKHKVDLKLSTQRRKRWER